MRNNIFDVVLEFGDVKEITTEGNHTSSASDNRADYKNLDQISDGRAPPSFLSNSRWRLTNSSTQIKVVDGVCGCLLPLHFSCCFPINYLLLNILPYFFSDWGTNNRSHHSCSLLFAHHTGTGA